MTNELEDAINQALSSLSPRQQKFCTVYASGESGAESARQAGYSKSRAHRTASRMLVSKGDNKVAHAVVLLRRKYQLEYGIAVSEKRDRLLRIADQSADVDGKGYQPSTAVSALRLLSEIDGDIRTTTAQGNQAQVTINIVTGIPESPGRVLETDETQALEND